MIEFGASESGLVRELVTDLAERRKPSGVVKPEGLRPTATFYSGSLFLDECLPEAESMAQHSSLSTLR